MGHDSDVLGLARGRSRDQHRLEHFWGQCLAGSAAVYPDRSGRPLVYVMQPSFQPSFSVKTCRRVHKNKWYSLLFLRALDLHLIHLRHWAALDLSHRTVFLNSVLKKEAGSIVRHAQ